MKTAAETVGERRGEEPSPTTEFPPMSPNKGTEVQALLGKLNGEIVICEGLLDNLIARLAPVLRGSPPQWTSQGSPEPEGGSCSALWARFVESVAPCTPLGALLLAAADEIRTCTLKLQNALARLEM